VLEGRRRQVQKRRKEGIRASTWFFFVRFFLRVAGFLFKSFGVQLMGKVFNGRDDARGGAVHGIADNRVTAVTNGVKDFPAGTSCEFFHFA